jgi:hypothetical protein
MNTSTLDPILASAIENELSALGTNRSHLRRNQRRTRRLTAVVGTVALAGVLTGGAIVINNLPGHTTTTALGGVVSGSFTGTASIDLGVPPVDAGAVILDITCTEGGAIAVPLVGENETATWECSNPIGNDTTHIIDARMPAAGSTSITITADPGTEWTVTAQYASASTTAWGVNENGQTYGEPNVNGLPDLSPALATNGKVGYIFATDLLAPDVGDSINVYESDGTTIVGKFAIGDN